MNDKRKKSEYSTLLSVLANASTDKAKGLLKKHTGLNATDVKDLEIKLAKLYASSPAKIDLEKEFAEIHPHKEFILKYNNPKVKVEPLQSNPEPIKTDEQNKVLKETVLHEGWAEFEGHPPCGNPNCPYCKRYINMDGNPNYQKRPNCPYRKQTMSNCSGGCSNCGGCSKNATYSNAEGGSEQSIPVQRIATETVVVLGIVSVVAIFGMVLYLKTNR